MDGSSILRRTFMKTVATILSLPSLAWGLVRNKDDKPVSIFPQPTLAPPKPALPAMATPEQTWAARSYCILNCFDWPESWGKPRQKPDSLSVEQMMATLKFIASERECARVWNVEHEKTMTEAEFAIWWVGATGWQVGDQL